MKIKFVVIVVVLLICVIPVVLSIQQRNTINKIIFNLNKALSEGVTEEVSGMFSKEALFEYKNQQMPYRMALDILNKKIVSGDFRGEMNVYQIDKLSKNEVIVLTINWFKIKNVSYEASGVVTLNQVQGKWKISKIYSDFVAFGNVFFDEPLN